MQNYRRRRLAPGLCAIALALGASQRHAAIVTYANPGEGDWNVGANWTGGIAPVAGDTAQISNGGTADITAAMGPQSILLVVAGNDANSFGNLKMFGGSLTTTSDVRIGGTATSTINATGTMNQSGGDIIMNGGNVNVGIGSAADGSTPSTGTYTMSGGTVTLNSSNIVAIGNRGTGTVNQSGGTIYVRGNGANSAAGVIQLGRNTAAVPGRGTYTISGGKALASNLQFGNANQTSNPLPTNTFNLQGTGVVKAGTVSILNTNATNIFNFTGGTLTANTISLPNLTNSGGTLRPATLAFTGQANSDDVETSLVGTMTINGNYTQNVGSILAIDLASASSFDTVSIGPGAVVGNASIAGTLAVSTIGGFDPTLGSTFDVLLADALTNTSTISGTTPSGNTYAPSIVTGGDGRQVLRLTVVEVPEPATFGALAAFAGATMLSRRRRA